MEKIYKAYQIVKTTAMSVIIREINMENKQPILNSFKGMQERRNVKKYSEDEYAVNYDRDYLFKYTG